MDGGDNMDCKILDTCPLFTELGSISFRPRTKPLVQRVYPHVYKPPALSIAATGVTSDPETLITSTEVTLVRSNYSNMGLPFQSTESEVLGFISCNLDQTHPHYTCTLYFRPS